MGLFRNYAPQCPCDIHVSKWTFGKAHKQCCATTVGSRSNSVKDRGLETSHVSPDEEGDGTRKTAPVSLGES